MRNSDIIKLKGDEGAMINLGGSNNIIYRKRGNVVTVTMIIDVSMNIQGSPYYLANLPDGFQPSSNVQMLVYRGDGTLGNFQIDTSGNIVTYVGLVNQTAFGTVSYVVS